MAINIYYDTFLVCQCKKQEDILPKLISSLPSDTLALSAIITIKGLLEKDIIASPYLFDLVTSIDMHGVAHVSYKGECLCIDKDNFLDFIKRFNIATLYHDGMYKIIAERAP